MDHAARGQARRHEPHADADIGEPAVLLIIVFVTGKPGATRVEEQRRTPAKQAQRFAGGIPALF